MEIELPDGTVLDAPDGADIGKVVRGYVSHQKILANPAEYNPESPEFKAKYGPESSTGEAFRSGFERMAAGASNLASKMKGKPLYSAFFQSMPQFSSDKALEERDIVDQPIKQQHPFARFGGEMVGGMALTAPLGGAGVAPTGANMLTRTLAAPVTKAALEGAVQGAAGAKVGEQGTDALKGAVLSAAVSKALGAGGRLVKGLVQKSEEAKALEQLAAQQGENIHIPLSQAAGDQDIPTKLGKVLYQEGLSLVPGVKGQLKKQAEEATEKVRELAVKEATPTGTSLPSNPGRDIQESVATIADSFDDAYRNTVSKYDFLVPSNLRSQLSQKIKQLAPNIDNESADKGMMAVRGLLRRFSNEGSRIEGSNLLVVRNELSKLAEKAPDYEKPAFKAGLDTIEEMIQTRLKGQSPEELARYLDLEEPARHFTGLQAAVKSAAPNSGRFSMAQLARNAKDATQLDLAQTANSVLSQPATGTSFAGRSVLGGLGLAGLGATAGIPAGLGVLGGANLLATRTAQRALTGDTAPQRAIVELLRKNPQSAEMVKKALQTAAVTNVGE